MAANASFCRNVCSSLELGLYQIWVCTRELCVCFNDLEVTQMCVCVLFFRVGVVLDLGQNQEAMLGVLKDLAVTAKVCCRQDISTRLSRGNKQ